MCSERGCECGCGSHHDAKGHMRRRRFLSNAEKVEKLNKYADELKKELTAVEERVMELQS